MSRPPGLDGLRPTRSSAYASGWPKPYPCTVVLHEPCRTPEVIGLHLENPPPTTASRTAPPSRIEVLEPHGLAAVRDTHDAHRPTPPNAAVHPSIPDLGHVVPSQRSNGRLSASAGAHEVVRCSERATGGVIDGDGISGSLAATGTPAFTACCAASRDLAPIQHPTTVCHRGCGQNWTYDCMPSGRCRSTPAPSRGFSGAPLPLSPATAWCQSFCRLTRRFASSPRRLRLSGHASYSAAAVSSTPTGLFSCSACASRAVPGSGESPSCSQ